MTLNRIELLLCQIFREVTNHWMAISSKISKDPLRPLTVEKPTSLMNFSYHLARKVMEQQLSNNEDFLKDLCPVFDLMFENLDGDCMIRNCWDT